MVSQLQLAAVAFCSASRNRQAKAMTAAGLTWGTVKRFAQMLEVLVRDAGAVITYADNQLISLSLGADFNRLTRRIKAQRVSQQVVERALQHVGPTAELQAVVQLDRNSLLWRVKVRVVFQFV
jgi:hypothetical protein